MQIIRNTITLDELKEQAEKSFGNLVKAVVDIEKEIMAIGGELHSDEEALLLEEESSQDNLWGINIYPSLSKDKRIEFDSMINLRPTQNNLSRGVDNPGIQEKIISIVNKLVKE
ncbi:hypothetical protein JW796_01155 [Candidatus Dojkabacteria bacterium]|nr:hypothetical protein [Candidatus Dojkabacteria bacterium]